MPVCKGCGAEIKWIKTQEGKNMPVEAEPYRAYIKISVMGPDRWYLADCYQPHWTVCPDADKFRRKKRGSAND